MSSPNNAMDPKTRNWHVLELCKRKLLTGDPTKYIEVSHKFAKWASDPRAYYDEVKPIIIDLLELTLKTLKSILGLEPNAHFNVHNFTENEYVKSWKRLIDVVYNFKDKFPHKDDTRLHARLNSLHLTASNPQDTIDVDATAPIVHASASPQIKACSSTPPIVHSSLSPTSKAPSLSPMTASSATLSVLSPEQITSAISAASPNAPPEQITSPIPPPLASSSSFIPEMVPTEEIHIADSSDSAPTKPRKKKKRRIAPVQDLVALDFAGRAAVSSDSTDVSTQPMDVQRSQETQVTLGDEVMMPMPPPASVAPSAISSASAPATEDVFRAGSERAASASEEILPSVPLASSIEEPTRSASAAPVQHHDIDADGRTQQEAVVPSSSIQGDSMQRAQSASSAMKLSKSPTPNFLDEAHMAGSPLVTLAHLTAFPPPASRSPSATLAEKPNTHAAASSMDMEPGEVTPSAAVISSPEDGQVPNLGMEDAMQVDSGKVEDTVDDDVEMVEGTSTVPAQNDQEIFASSAQLPQARPAPQISKISLPKSAGLGADLSTGKRAGGTGTFEFTLNFTVGETQFASVENWNSRMTKPIDDDIEMLCLSLACYTKADLERNSENFDVLRSRWPRGQHLHLNVTKRDGSTKTIPLSPPTACTPDGFVDLGPFVRKGSNAVKIVQNSDLSAYVFCLHVHHPTLAQIQKYNQMVEKELEWHEWCKGASAPLNLPTSKFANLQQL